MTAVYWNIGYDEALFCVHCLFVTVLPVTSWFESASLVASWLVADWGHVDGGALVSIWAYLTGSTMVGLVVWNPSDQRRGVGWLVS